VAEEDLFLWQLDLEFFKQSFDGALPREDFVADIGVFLVPPIWTVTYLVHFCESAEKISGVGNPHFFLWRNDYSFLVFTLIISH
jgi:hypothetical protein